MCFVCIVYDGSLVFYANLVSPNDMSIFGFIFGASAIVCIQTFAYNVYL